MKFDRFLEEAMENGRCHEWLEDKFLTYEEDMRENGSHFLGRVENQGETVYMLVMDVNDDGEVLYWIIDKDDEEIALYIVKKDRSDMLDLFFDAVDRVHEYVIEDEKK